MTLRFSAFSAAVFSTRFSALAVMAALLFASGPAASQAAGQMGQATISSPISDIVFKDTPQMLPVDSRFSQAIQTVAFDLGMQCGQIESYGWSIGTNEQERVNDIFTDTARELARIGYSVTPQNPGAAAADITVYSATMPDRNVLFMWSAGETGLLLLLCDAQTDVQKQGFGRQGGARMQTPTETELPVAIEAEDIVGEWVGTYSCIDQGVAGGTLTVSRVKKDKTGFGVDAIFSFYPLKEKNPGLERGSYRLSGRFDPITQRAILEPGAWLQRPDGFMNAVIITQFNMTQKHVSAIFQGTTGCTSFEGAYKAGSANRAATKAPEDAPKKKRPAPKAPKKKPVAKPVAEVAPAPVFEPLPAFEEPVAAPAEAAPVANDVTAAPTTPAIVTETPAIEPAVEPITVPDAPPAQ